jgi:hypothetical protein
MGLKFSSNCFNDQCALHETQEFSEHKELNKRSIDSFAEDNDTKVHEYYGNKIGHIFAESEDGNNSLHTDVFDILNTSKVESEKISNNQVLNKQIGVVEVDRFYGANNKHVDEKPKLTICLDKVESDSEQSVLSDCKPLNSSQKIK